MSKKRNNYRFIDSAILNNATYIDYLERFKKIALSMFEWINLPESMNSQYLELSLFKFGMASILHDENFGFINTNCSSSGQVNIYGLPTEINCYSFSYQNNRKVYSGFDIDDEKKKAILVLNNVERTPTLGTLELFAYRLYQAERTIDVNVSSQKFPVLLLVNEKQRITMENLYSQYEGNKPCIFGDREQLSDDVIRCINTGAPYITDKLSEYKKEIWNEALTFLGVNNIMIDKKERLVADEANSNNELINLNLQSFFKPRKLACTQFNKYFGLEGTNKAIDVRLNSDLHNIIKNNESVINDYNLGDEKKWLNIQ